MSEPVRAIIFDFGSVLSRPLVQVLAEVERELGLPEGIMHRAGWGMDHWKQAEVGGLSYDDYREACIAALTDQGVSASVARLAWTNWYDTFYTEELMPGIPELLAKLHGRYQLAILSNAAPNMEHRIGVLCGLSKWFDPIISSATIGIAKPDRRAYEHTLQAIGRRPEECFFVDDTKANVEAAEAMGIRGYHFGDTPGLIAALRAQGVDV